MSPLPPQFRPNASGSWEPPGKRITHGPASRAYLPGGAEGLSGLQLSPEVFFAEALDSALMLLHADGGELVALDDARQTMVLRARRTRPRIEGSFGSASRPSQPIPPPGRMQLPQLTTSGNTRSPDAGGAGGGIADETTGLDEIDAQATQLLPAALNARSYIKGERLIGQVWQRGEAMILRGEECRKLPGGSSPSDPDAAWHLAVPIPLPQSLMMARTVSNVIGVISVYNRDPLWSFTAQHVELLRLHADRVGRAMVAEELARQNESQSDLLNVLGADVSEMEQHVLFSRLRDVVRRAIDAPSFAVLLYHTRQDEVTFELAERDNQPMPQRRMAASALPPWWNPVRGGGMLCISAPEERAAHPEYCVLGWGGDAPVQSILAAPLIVGNTLLGAIVAGSPRANVYAPEDTRLFASIAQSGALVIQKSLLAEETRVSLARTREKERQLAMLNNAVLTLNATLNLDETLRSVVTQAVHISDAQVCAALLVDEDTRDEVVVRAVHSLLGGDTTPTERVRIPKSWRGLKELLDSGQFMLMDHLEAEWEDDTPAGRWLRQQEMQLCLALPLIQQKTELDQPGQESALGVLLVHTPNQRHHFPSEEIGFLQGLASQAAAVISNARLYEKLQQAYEQQKVLDQLKDDFILTVSHEFRTPVTAIDGYVSLISRHGLKLEQAKLDQFAGEIRLATSQLMGMINTLHDASNLDSQPLHVIPGPVNVRAAAESAIATQSPEAKARIQVEIPADLWVLGDADRLPHVFSNLLVNAIKYAPGDSPCTLTARFETRAALVAAGRLRALAEGAAERWMVVGVQDRGQGITPEDQAKLFQKFVRLTRSLTTSVRGTGLGLWICRQYLEAMGGAIWVESEYGVGSHFQFCLPGVSAPENMQAQAHEP